MVTLLRLKGWRVAVDNLSLASLGGVGGIGYDWAEAIGRFIMCT